MNGIAKHIYIGLQHNNLLSVTNSATGNSMAHAYDYDGLYRLVSATGTYAGADNKTAAYTLEMQYDNLHNITSKKQHVEQQDIQFNGMLKAGYELAYNYTNNPFQISTLGDENYRTDGDVANNLIEKQHAYEYDANGNLVYVNTAREKKDGTQTEKSQERKLLWDEENRLEAIDENGFVSNYWYDAAGERTVKTSGESEQMYVNGIFSGGNTSTANFTAYVNPYIVVSKGGHYTKHIYIGSQRIVSKLGDFDSYGADPRRIEYAGNNVDGAIVNYKSKYETSQQTIKDRYAIFEVPYLGIDNDDYVNGQGFCCDDTPQGNTTKAAMQNDNPELFQYYYHSDHLGSTSLITNLDGEVVQHVEYVPFGEVFIEERNNTWNTPYLFNAKELDEETGLYYYGARYYEPRISLWLSADPMQEKYPNISTYAYCTNNPIRYIDTDGQQPFEPDFIKALIYQEIGIPYERAMQSVKNTISRVFGSVKVQVGVSAGVGIGFKATKYAQFRGNLEIAGADVTLNTGQANVNVLKADGTVKIGDKGGLNFKGELAIADVDFANVQNVFKLESPDFDKFTFATAEGKAQFTKLFEASGSAWAIQNSSGEWSFLDGKHGLGIKQDIFEKTDIQAELKLGVKVKIGVDLKQLFNIEEEGK